MEEKTKFVLTQDQKDRALNRFSNPNRVDNPPSVSEILRLLFGEGKDTRSPEGMAVRELLASFREKRKKEKLPKDQFKLELTPEQEEYIKNHRFFKSPLEIAQELFNKNSLTNESEQFKAVKFYVNTLEKTDKKDEEAIEYRAPASLLKVIVKANRYLGREYKEDELTPIQKKNLVALMNYVSNLRFIRQINSFNALKDQELFESEFFRVSDGKSDLTAEEVDQYIMYCNEVCKCVSISKHISIFQDDLNNDLFSDQKLKTNCINIIRELRQQESASQELQRKLIESLVGKRNSRIEKQKEENSSILNLVNLWKIEEDRIKLIRYAEFQKEDLKKDVDKILTSEELMCIVLGISPDEAVHGSF